MEKPLVPVGVREVALRFLPSQEGSKKLVGVREVALRSLPSQIGSEELVGEAGHDMRAVRRQEFPILSMPVQFLCRRYCGIVECTVLALRSLPSHKNLIEIWF
jgi:hypothetical protein